MPHDDGETQTPQGVSQEMPSTSGTDATTPAQSRIDISGIDISSGKGKNWRIYGDPGDFGRGLVFGLGSTTPFAGTLFGNPDTLPKDYELQASALEGALKTETGQSLFSPDLYVMIPVAYWCQVTPHVVFGDAILRSDEDEPQCPDHHVAVEHLYTRRKLG
jgi:hypothetical protein